MTARAPQQSRGGFVQLPDQTQLPYLQQSGPLNLVVAHGLGVDPPQKSHVNDISFDLWHDCHKLLRQHPSASSASSRGSGSVVFYTARGHGQSHGWQPTASQAQPHQPFPDNETTQRLAQAFSWPALANDMATVIDDRFGSDTTPITLLGQSMGAATALFYAMNHPQRVQALILARLPRIWQARQAVQQDYIQAAQQLYYYSQQYPPPDSYYGYLPLLGAAHTDLPSREEIDRWKKLADIPVLVLGHANDVAHPLESGVWLQEAVLPHATREDTALDETAARQQWPRILADWLIQQNTV